VPLLTAVIDGNTLIHRAIVTEQFDACKVLIDMQLIDLESRTVNGLTALQVCMTRVIGQFSLDLQLLLQSQRFSLSLFCHLITAGVRVSFGDITH
jgi:ankyrin repeat protein